MSHPATRALLLGGGVVAAGYVVARMGAGNSVGEAIPTTKGDLRTQGAIGEAVKAGMSREEATKKIQKVETRGGDKGLVYDSDERIASPK